jgi:hypothetical protein
MAHVIVKQGAGCLYDDQTQQAQRRQQKKIFRIFRRGRQNMAGYETDSEGEDQRNGGNDHGAQQIGGKEPFIRPVIRKKFPDSPGSRMLRPCRVVYACAKKRHRIFLLYGRRRALFIPGGGYEKTETAARFNPAYSGK